MRKAAGNVENAKDVVLSLLGREVSVRYNRGRNRICFYRGTVAAAHSNVFVIKIHDEIFDRLSCSYIDMVCGEVALNVVE